MLFELKVPPPPPPLYLVHQLVALQSGQLLGPYQERLRLKIDTHFLGDLVHLHRFTQPVQERHELEKRAIFREKKFFVGKRSIYFYLFFIYIPFACPFENVPWPARNRSTGPPSFEPSPPIQIVRYPCFASWPPSPRSIRSVESSIP